MIRSYQANVKLIFKKDDRGLILYQYIYLGLAVEAILALKLLEGIFL